ncbi:MAG: DUF3540 domain-containing protein [Lysobacter sp.]|nr:DUF3540 domain-containing protein [Lysobacter sp.]
MRTVIDTHPTESTPPRSAAVAAANLHDFHDLRIAVVFDDGDCLLGNGARAARAVSCLVEPLAGDRVLASAGADGRWHVLHILAREAGGAAHLSVPGADALALRQQRVSVHALEALELACAGDASLTSARTLSINARSLFCTVAGTLVEQAAQYVGRMGQYLLDARELLRLHGQHALITAERDVKVDGERISMG